MSTEREEFALLQLIDQLDVLRDAKLIGFHMNGTINNRGDESAAKRQQKGLNRATVKFFTFRNGS